MDEIRINGYDMNKLANIAYVNSQVACALIELEAMKADNDYRLHRSESPAWSYDYFLQLINKYQLGHNSVVTNLNRDSG